MDNNGENPDRYTKYVDESYDSIDDLLNDSTIPEAVKEGLLDFGELDESVDLKKISYNRALGLADDNDKPVIYGYTVKGGAFKDVAPVVCDDVRKCTDDFQKAHPDYSVVYVAYPGGMQIDESFEDEEIDFDKCLEAFNDFDDDVECCECHDMFHKCDCEKGEHGYVCKHCREMSEYYDREATADPESTVEPSKDVPVKDCPVNDVITHCEEENIDCEMKKPALEKPLTEDADEIELWSAEEVQRAIDEIL